MELSTYFRINQAGTGQFENLLLQMKEVTFHLKAVRHQVVMKISCCRISRLDDAEIKYSTVQNWYPGNKEGKGGVLIL
jgi:Fe-S cluster assembly protein SufB